MDQTHVSECAACDFISSVRQGLWVSGQQHTRSSHTTKIVTSLCNLWLSLGDELTSALSITRSHNEGFPSRLHPHLSLLRGTVHSFLRSHARHIISHTTWGDLKSRFITCLGEKDAIVPLTEQPSLSLTNPCFSNYSHYLLTSGSQRGCCQRKNAKQYFIPVTTY